jgi:hypothetical protein
MKKIAAVLLVAVCCLLWAGCAQATNSDDTQEEEQESTRAKENREYYNKHLLGRWHRWNELNMNYEDIVSEFREDGFTIYEGDTRTTVRVDAIDFETLFGYYYDGHYSPSYGDDDDVYVMAYPDPANKKVFTNFHIVFYPSYRTYDADFYVIRRGYTDGHIEDITSSISPYYSWYVKEGSENYTKWKDSLKEKEDDKKTIDIRGSYTLTVDSLNHTLTFNNDGTYDFVHATNPSWNRSNSWSTNKNEITMGWEASGTEYTEVLVASKSGATVTLEVKDSSVAISYVRNSFSLTPDRKMILVEK